MICEFSPFFNGIARWAKYEVACELKSRRNRLWIWVFQSKFHDQFLEFWHILEFTFVLLEGIGMFTFVGYVVMSQSFFFFNYRYHTFWLIFSISMRAISLKNGLKFAYHTFQLIFSILMRAISLKNGRKSGYHI